jgi:hypothetical protein
MGVNDILSPKIPKSMVEMLGAADTSEAVFPPTILYNEGWMLRLILCSAAKGVSCLPFEFSSDARWYSEALLASPFLARHRGDELAEAYTHADGVVGHFNFRPATKALVLEPDARQFVVLEAKMSSLLSAGTRRAATYDQAARTVACMAQTIEQSRIRLRNLSSIGFYLIAPEEQLGRGAFQKQMTRSNITERVQLRIDQYRNDKMRTRRLREWFETIFQPLIERIDLRCWSWETAVDKITEANPSTGKEVQGFYSQCIRFEARDSRSSGGIVPMGKTVPSWG